VSSLSLNRITASEDFKHFIL